MSLRSFGSLARWRLALRERLGELAEPLAAIVPTLTRLLGTAAAQPGSSERGAVEARNRMLVAVSRLLGVIASPSRPVVLVLDDLQWSDPGSIRMLEHLLHDREGAAKIAAGLLIVGAYRDAEFAPAHPLNSLLARLGWAVDDEQDRDRLQALARLLEIAGRAAIRASSYAKAERYLETGSRALARLDANEQLGLSLAIHHARAVALNGGRTRAEALFDALARTLDGLARQHR